MRNFLAGGVAIAAIVCAVPALAGEEPLYQSAPDWIAPGTVDHDPDQRKLVALIDQQIRLEDGQVAHYRDIAMRIDTPQSLSQFGTVTAAWLPDKGDLIVHRVELLRGEEVIDVLAGGQKLDVLRREAGLERRELNGVLTATMAVRGARVGDTLRFSYTVTSRDQALGDALQVNELLIAEPAPIETGQMTMSWPTDETLHYRVLRNVTLPEPTVRDGYNWLSVDLPLAELPEQPGDAPVRYQIPALFQATTLNEWEDLSRLMAPIFATEGTIVAGSPLASQVTRIEAVTTDPLERTAAAVKLVQDEVSYLANGLNGGNYLPQSPAETWELRYGDCKAKSLLLAAILREMGITAEVALVNSQLGDAVSQMAPMAAAFDHMIVRAEVGGKTLWLDGTQGNTRLNTIDRTPAFHTALPVGANGSGLVKMDQTPWAQPESVLTVTFDQTAGDRVPALADVRVVLNGGQVSFWRAMQTQMPGEQMDDLLANVISSSVGDGQVFDHVMTFDEEDGTATIAGKALVTTLFREDSGKRVYSVPTQPAADIGFSPDRSKPEWRDIPVSISGPGASELNLTLLLPGSGDAYTLAGDANIDRTVAGRAIRSQAELEGNRFVVRQNVSSVSQEISAEDVAA